MPPIDRKGKGLQVHIVFLENFCLVKKTTPLQALNQLWSTHLQLQDFTVISRLKCVQPGTPGKSKSTAQLPADCMDVLCSRPADGCACMQVPARLAKLMHAVESQPPQIMMTDPMPAFIHAVTPTCPIPVLRWLLGLAQRW